MQIITLAATSAVCQYQKYQQYKNKCYIWHVHPNLKYCSMAEFSPRTNIQRKLMCNKNAKIPFALILPSPKQLYNKRRM